MTICPNTHHQCHCQPQEGVMCPYGPTPNDWQKDEVAMTKDQLTALVSEYVATLDDEHREEYFQTEREYARAELDGFLEWLDKRPADEPPAEHPALAAADALAHQYIFTPYHERYWQARGGHSACTVCNQAISEPPTAQSAWDVVNALIKAGELGGNGLDKTAERNGLILAANAIAALPGVQPRHPNRGGSHGG